MPYTTRCSPGSFLRILGHLFLFLLALIACSATGYSQADVVVGNRFIEAHVATDQKSGKFWITAGKAYGGIKFLYQSGPQITSHVVFQVTRGTSVTYYCNVPDPWMNARPTVASQGVQFKPYDSIYTSPDTIAVIWTGVGGFTVTMRFIPERPRSVYDDGSDMLLEFEYENKALPGATFAILLMLDGVNGEAVSNSGAGTGDKSSIVTDQGYFPVSTFSKKFSGPPNDILPEFYHIGNFRYELPLNTVYPLHKLSGKTHYGTPLDPPTYFAIGDWKQFWDIGWNFPSDLGTRAFEDCATLMRWDGLTSRGKVRTSFGMNNKGSNDMYTCRDDSLFVDIRTKRLITQAVKNGPYDVETFQVEMWVSNLNHQYSVQPAIRIASPISSIPDGTGRLTLDPSTPATQTVQLMPRATAKLTWILQVNKASTDTMARLVFYHKMSAKSFEKPFKDGCNPMITVIGYQDPPPNPPPDTVPPVIERTGSGRNTTAYWNFRTYDRHLNFKYDEGLDRIQILANDNNNFVLTMQPDPFPRCDTTVDVNMVASVADTSAAAHLIFAVYDCKGNVSRDTIDYRPRPDVFKPQVDSLIAEPFTRPSCNARVYNVYLSDVKNQEADKGDHGFGTIEVLNLVNFKPIEVNFAEGGKAVAEFDPYLDFRIEVDDSLQDGTADIRVADFEGNADTLHFSYCTIPDTIAPLGYRLDQPDKRSWRLAASDTSAWDRGLADIVVLSNLGNNVLYNGVDPSTHPWSIVPGTPYISDLGGLFTVADDKNDASLVLEIRDTRYKDLPAGHADTVRMTFSATPDTLAPNFLNANFAPDVGSTGVVATVEVNDIHYLGNGDLYKYDLGLATVIVDPTKTTPNMRVRPSAPISFSPGDMRTTFQIEVLDTLAATIVDSICFVATDVAGNTSMRCYYYPIAADARSPIFTGQLSTDRTTITGVATDERLYDRGLGSITLENPVNLDPGFALTGLNGVPSANISIDVLDPTKPVAGTLVIRDMISEATSTPEVQTVHTRRLPFYLPTATVRLILPPVVEGGAEFDVPIMAVDSFPGSAVSGISFDATYDGMIDYLSARGVSTSANVVVGTGSLLSVSLSPSPSRLYVAGDTLAVLRFKTGSAKTAELFHVRIVPGTEKMNGGLGTIVSDAAPGDTGVSTLALPPMYLRLNPDSVAYSNGDCGRVLTSLGSSKRSALAILRVSPQPIGTDGGRSIRLDIRNLPSEGGRAELMAADGSVVTVVDLRAGAEGSVTEASLELPKTLASGMYFLKVTGSTGLDIVKVLVTE